MLTPGTRLGSYEIVALIGKGGMGEVYRARDITLQRDVAIKVLPAAVEADAGRLARFSREAQLLASFNHRNIASIYGFFDAGRAHVLVMELVEGPTLAARLANGPMPIAEALTVAKQIAEALEAAHEQGIIHRDLKPANIKLRPDGEVKVLDFGLARALDAKPSADHADSPTLTTPVPITNAGAILGTGPYMSPEQARGFAVDRRTDIWAFGVVLWEMLTSTQLFAGHTLSDTVASVLSAEPDWKQLPAQTPLPILRLLERSLQKDRKLRLDSATVARLEIDEALQSPEKEERPAAKPRLIPLGLAVLASAALAALATWASLRGPTVAAPSLRLRTELGADIALQQDFGAAAVLSPDGQTVVFASEATTAPAMLYVRRLEQLTAAPLPGTEDASSPFFSPDGKWVAFFADGKLKRTSITGGTPTTIADAVSGRGGTWAEDGAIIFSPNAQARTVLHRVPSTGGTPQPLTSLLDGEISHRWPQVLPADRGLVYVSNTSDNWDDARVMVQPLPSGTPKVVQPGFYGRYVASGHLLYVKGGTIYAAPFDLDRLEVTGPSVAAVPEVVADATTGGAQFSASQTGTLVYLQGQTFFRTAPMAWMDRGGTTVRMGLPPSNWANPRVSPDGKQLAYDVHDGKQSDVWVLELATGKGSRLTFDRSDESNPVWTPDGQRITFTSTRDGAPNLYWQRADGTGAIERLTTSSNAQTAGSWHPGGKVLAFQEVRPDTRGDVVLLELEDGGAGPKPGRQTTFAGGASQEAEPSFSPDGRWLAYHGTETGRAQVFVRPLQGPGKWQISTAGGRDATWGRTRPELLFFGFTDGRIMTAPFTVSGASFRHEAPHAWSNTPIGRPSRSGRTFDLHLDGERVVVVPADRQNRTHMMLVLNFFEQLRQNAAATQ